MLWSHNYKTAVGIDLFVSCGTKILGPGHNPGSGQSPGGSWILNTSNMMFMLIQLMVSKLINHPVRDRWNSLSLINLPNHKKVIITQDLHN